MTRCRRGGRWPLLLVICLAIALGLPGCATSKSPGAAVREFFGLMSSGRYEAASQLLTADAKAFFALGLSFAALGSQFTGGKLGTMPAGRIEITREVIRGDTAEVEATFHYADGTVESMGSNTLVMENGQWKIALDLFGTGSGSSGSSPTPGTSSTSQAAPQPAGSPTTASGTSSTPPNVSAQAGSQALQTPGDVARQFFVLTSRGDYEAAAELMTDEAKMLFVFGAFLTTGLSGVAGEEAGCKPIAQVEITREVVQGDTAEVECTLHYADGSVDPVGSVALARVAGQWKIATDASGSSGQSIVGPSTQATPSKPSVVPDLSGSSPADAGGPSSTVTQTRQPPALSPGASGVTTSTSAGAGPQAAATLPTRADQASVEALAVGSWTGTVRQPGHSLYSVEMTITTIKPEQPAGAVTYPELSCGGTVRCEGVSDGQITLRENIVTDRDRRCVDGVKIVLTVDKTLPMRATLAFFMPDGSAAGTADLERVGVP